MKRKGQNCFVSILTALMICILSMMLLLPVQVSGFDVDPKGKDQLKDALDAAIVRVFESGRFREILSEDTEGAAPLVVHMADCYPRLVDGDDELYPFPENPTGLLAEIISTGQIKMGTFDVVTTPGTFHMFDYINPTLMRAIIDELGIPYGFDPDINPIEIVKVLLWPPSSSLVFTGLYNGDFHITDFVGALGATTNLTGGPEMRRRKLARFTCTVFGSNWYIHVRDGSSYTSFDDVVADATADLCVGQLSSRLSADFFPNAQSITQKFLTDDLTECSKGVSDETYDAYLHFDPNPLHGICSVTNTEACDNDGDCPTGEVCSPLNLRSIPTQIASGIPIWIAGDACGTNDCLADANRDGKVNLTDLVLMKDQFLRTDCCQ